MVLYKCKQKQHCFYRKGWNYEKEKMIFMGNRENELLARLTLVLKKADLDRIRIEERTDTVLVDLHNLGTKDAKILLNNIINLNKNDCNIKVIHGYNNGIALKDMINRRFVNPRIEKKTECVNNKGVTILACKGF